MQDSAWNSFMILLRAGLWEQDLGDYEVPVFDWPEVLRFGSQQAVMGLLVSGVSRLSGEHLPPETVRAQLQAWEIALRRVSDRLVRLENSLLSEFRKAMLVGVVQKGSQSAKYYPDPALRQGGDIDIYFQEFTRARALVPEARTAPDGAAVFTRDGVTVELHPRYYDLRLDSPAMPAPGTPCAELLLQSAHILKHAVGTGIGLKQCCDLARALTVLEGRYDKGELHTALKRAGMLRWHQMLCSLLVEDLGLDAAHCLPDFTPCDVDYLRRIIRAGGNLGKAEKSRHEGIVARKAATAGSFLRHLPFSLRYAPRAAFTAFRELVLGNLRI